MNSYWNNTGHYQVQCDQIKKDVPTLGHAKTLPVELFRCGQNVYYEIFNNGGCNLDPDDVDEFSKNTQLQHIASYGIDTSEIDDMVEKMVKENDDEYEIDSYDDSESTTMCIKICKDGGFMDIMMNSVIEKCKELGYKFDKEF